jgi:hypothetical protein
MVATQDVEMEVVEETAEDPKKVAVQEIREHVKQIDKAVSSKEPRFILRVLRTLPNTRRKLNSTVLRTLANHLFPAGSERDAILVHVEDGTPLEPEVTARRAIVKTPLPEVDAYFHLLALVRLIDANLLDKASVCGKHEFAIFRATYFYLLIACAIFSSTTDEQNHVTKSQITGFDCCKKLFLSFASCGAHKQIGYNSRLSSCPFTHSNAPQ